MHLGAGSSVSTVSGYGLDDRAIEVRSPAEDFSSSLCELTFQRWVLLHYQGDNGGSAYL
jgi:hypothetical protein